MTQDEIIRMAREAGIPEWWGDFDEATDEFIEHLKRFAALVAAHERESVIDLVAMYGGSVDLEAAIRARNSTSKCQFDTKLVDIEAAVLAEREACAKVCEQVGQDWNYHGIAAAIRARGEK